MKLFTNCKEEYSWNRNFHFNKKQKTKSLMDHPPFMLLGRLCHFNREEMKKKKEDTLNYHCHYGKIVKLPLYLFLLHLFFAFRRWPTTLISLISVYFPSIKAGNLFCISYLEHQNYIINPKIQIHIYMNVYYTYIYILYIYVYIVYKEMSLVNDDN